jgi:hypothetical protein
MANEIGTSGRRYETRVTGTSDRLRTNYAQNNEGALAQSGPLERIYVRAPAAVPVGTVAVTITAPVTTLNGDGTRKVTTQGTATVAAGAGWNSDAAFAANEYGWVWRNKTI